MDQDQSSAPGPPQAWGPPAEPTTWQRLKKLLAPLGVGIALAVMTVLHPNFLLLLILVFSAPRIFSLFRAKTEQQRRYFEVTPAQRAAMALLYFGLVALLVLGMRLSHIPREMLGDWRAANRVPTPPRPRPVFFAAGP